MSDSMTVVPHNREELYSKLIELFKSRSHVKSIHVDEVHGTIAINLDGAAHFTGHSDLKIPVRRSSIPKAQALVNRINASVAQGIEPNRTDSDELYDLIEGTH